MEKDKLRVLVVSDNHGSVNRLRYLLQIEGHIDAMVHCGDFEGSEEYIKSMVDCPLYMVKGNNDFFSKLPSEMTFMLGDKRCFLTHGHGYAVGFDRKNIAQAGRERGADIVFFGHSHRPVTEVDGLLLINPGSLTYPRQEGGCPTYVILEIEEGKVWVQVRQLHD